MTETVSLIVALVCLTIVALTAIGTKEDSKTAREALGTLKDALKTLLHK